MTIFKDSKNREWKLSLTIGKARAVKERTGIDILQPEKGEKTLPEILVDEFAVAEICFVLLESEFEKLKVDPTNMLQEDWDGTTSKNAYNALLDELTLFFEDRGQPGRAQVIQKTKKAVQAGMDIMAEEVAKMEPEVEVRKEYERKTAGNTSGKQPEDSESTPDP